MEISTPPIRRTRRLGSFLVNLVCVLVSLFGLLFIVPAAFGLERYVIAGGSMTGAISRGSVVFEESVPVSDLRVGDVITYMPPADSSIENLVTHRIVTIDADTFRTKGDANPDVDPWTFKLTAATQPRVVAHVPGVGYAFLALQDRVTRMLVIGIPAVLVGLSSLFQLIGGVRRRPARPVRSAHAAVDSTPSGPLRPLAPGIRIPVQSATGGSGRRTPVRTSPRRAARRRVEAGR